MKQAISAAVESSVADACARELAFDTLVAWSDPLDLDGFFPEKFHRICQGGALAEMVMFIEGHLNSLCDNYLHGLYAERAVAAKRDLSFIARGILKLGGQISDCPVVEHFLQYYGKVVGEVPIDGPQDCTTRNPSGSRQRVLIPQKEGKVFFDGVNTSMRSTLNTMPHLARAHSSPINSLEFSEAMEQAVSVSGGIVQGMLASRYISREVFNDQIVPFLVEVVVGGERLKNSGSQVPVWFLDFVLGIHTVEDESASPYKDYMSDRLRYLSPELRRALGGVLGSGQQSIWSRIREAVERGEKSPEFCKAVLATSQFVEQTLLAFRKQHYRPASEILRHREDGKGTGGGDRPMLSHFIVRTVELNKYLVSVLAELK